MNLRGIEDRLHDKMIVKNKIKELKSVFPYIEIIDNDETYTTIHYGRTIIAKKYNLSKNPLRCFSDGTTGYIIDKFYLNSDNISGRLLYIIQVYNMYTIIESKGVNIITGNIEDIPISVYPFG